MNLHNPILDTPALVQLFYTTYRQSIEIDVVAF